MTAENRDPCIAWTLAHEGKFVNHPDDPGGATNMGITMETLADWRGRGVSVQDVKNLSVKEAKDIYLTRYWRASRNVSRKLTPRSLGDQLPAGLDLSVYDFGVNAGPHRAVMTLQEVVGTAQDGVLGPVTLEAVNRYEDVHELAWDHLIGWYSETRRDYYRSLSTFDTFGKGWLRRVDECEAESLRLAEGEEGETVYPPGLGETMTKWAKGLDARVDDIAQRQDAHAKRQAKMVERYENIHEAMSSRINVLDGKVSRMARELNER